MKLLHISHHTAGWFPKATLKKVKQDREDFPGGPVDNEPGLQCKGHGFPPWSKKIPRAAKSMNHNYWSPHALETVLHSKRSHCNGKKNKNRKETLCDIPIRKENWQNPVYIHGVLQQASFLHHLKQPTSKIACPSRRFFSCIFVNTGWPHIYIFAYVCIYICVFTLF